MSELHNFNKFKMLKSFTRLNKFLTKTNIRLIPIARKNCSSEWGDMQIITDKILEKHEA